MEEVGAGGAGSSDCGGGGGYSGGTEQSCIYNATNGLAGKNENIYAQYVAGSGYFIGAVGVSRNGINREKVAFGGLCGQGVMEDLSHIAGSGGTAGKGGTISKSENSKVYAFNGNLYTDGTAYNNGINQCPIYAQLGIVVEKYGYEKFGGHVIDSAFQMRKISDSSKMVKSGYSNDLYNEGNFKDNKIRNFNSILGIDNKYLSNVDMSKLGVGSGAGYIEVSNGTYKVDSKLN